MKFFLQFACTNLDGSQKERINLLNLHQKDGGTQKRGGVPSENGGFDPGGNYDIYIYIYIYHSRSRYCTNVQ